MVFYHKKNKLPAKFYESVFIVNKQRFYVHNLPIRGDEMNKRMKKYIAACVVWLCVLTIGVTCKDEAITYEIHYDTNSQDMAEVKNEMLKRYIDLTNSVHAESEAVMLLHNLEQFAWRTDMTSSFVDDHVLIEIGDGAGPVISGDLEVGEFCLPEVKPKSLLAEWLGL